MENEQVELVDFQKPKRSFKVLWSVIITFIVLGAAAAYGYSYMEKQYKSEILSRNLKLDALHKQADELSNTTISDGLDGLSEEPLDPNLTTKLFQSSKLGISLRYPKSDFAEEKTIGEMTYIFIDKKAIADIPVDSEFPQQYFSISALGELCGLSSVKSNAGGEKITDIKIAGVNGWKFTMTKASDLDGSFSTNYYFNSKSDCYHISVGNSDAKGTHDSAIDDIISSITFNK